MANAFASSVEPRYPARYAQALDRPAATIPTDAAARFVALFEAIDQPGIGDRVDALYATDVYFSDTLFETQNVRALRRHFERIQGSGTRIDVDLDDAIGRGTDLYLRWRMQFTFKVGGRDKVSRTIGMSLLRFDETGRIRFQQDFWDSTEGFYRHLPGVGWVIDTVAARMNEEH